MVWLSSSLPEPSRMRTFWCSRPAWMSSDCFRARREQAVVDVLEVRAHRGGKVAAVDVELDAQLPRLADAGHQVRRRDQGFGRHDVGQHRGAAKAGALDDGDLRAQ